MHTYAVLGHSETRQNFEKKIVPDNVTLVLLTSCGLIFRENNVVMNALKNQNSLNRFLNQNSRANSPRKSAIKRIRQIYTGGREYADQLIEMPLVNNGLVHGVYNVPRNLSTVSRNEALFNTNKSNGLLLSTILQRISSRGGGVVFCFFCRVIAGASYFEPRHVPGIGHVPHKIFPLPGSKSRVRKLGTLRKFMALRPHRTRNEFKQQIRTAFKVMSRVPKPNRTVTRISAQTPPKLRVKFVFKPKPEPPLIVRLRLK